MRAVATLLLSAILIAPAAAEPGPPDPERVSRLILQLDDEDAATRDAAAAELREIGPAALDALRAAGKDGKLGAEGKARAAALIPDIEAGQERRRIWGDTRDASREVKDELKRLNENADSWELHPINGPALDRAMPKILFVIADWVGTEKAPVATQLWAVCREPAQVLRIRSNPDYPLMAKWIPPAPSGREKEIVAGALTGLEQARMRTEGPFEFHADIAEAPVADDGNTTYADSSLLCVSFDEKGLLRQVAYLADMQRKRK